MLYFTSSNREALQFLNTGRLRNSENFIHSRRTLDHFVLLAGCEGTLYIAQDDTRYTLKSGQYLLLFPGHTHYGYAPSGPELSYYWCHFSVPEAYRLLDESSLPGCLMDITIQNDWDIYLLPEYGNIAANDRTSMLFRQLMDIARQDFYSAGLPNFTLSLLAMEITQKFLEKNRLLRSNHPAHSNLSEIEEWIRSNYEGDLSVRRVADVFGYSPTYLSSIFKKDIGIPLSRYINRVRIQAAKHLLLDTVDPVRVIAEKAGFNDEKHFIKTFRQFENTTPTLFRRIYFRQKMNQA